MSYKSSYTGPQIDAVAGIGNAETTTANVWTYIKSTLKTYFDTLYAKINASGTITVPGFSGSPVPSFDASGAHFDMSNGGSATITNSAYSYLFISEQNTTGNSALIFVSNNSTYIIWQNSSTFAASDTAGKFCVFASGNTITFKNNIGGIARIFAVVTKLSPT